jgi:hypothetical protein
MSERNRTCIIVCTARRATGSEAALRADLEISVKLMAHVEWKRTVRATFRRDGGGAASGGVDIRL